MPRGSLAGRSWVRWSLAAVPLLLVLAGVAIFVASSEYDAVDRVAFSPAEARDRLEAQRRPADDVPMGPARTEPDAAPDDTATAERSNGPDDLVPEPGPGADPSPAAPVQRNDELLTTLILGSDARAGMAGSRADAIMIVVVPADDDPIVASIPRDLWVENPCTGGMSRINAGLNGCGPEVSGPDLMAVMVEDLAGIEIDHYAEVDFEGFVEIVDAVGGLELCTDHPVRDPRVEDLSLPGGCVQADGTDVLAWTQSRRTQELVDGRWRTMPGVSAFTRDERQQDVMLAIVDRVYSYGSLPRFRSVAHKVQDSVTLDEGLPFSRAVRLAWQHRDLDPWSARRLTIPTTGFTTSGGAQVVRADRALSDLLDEVLGEVRNADGGSNEAS